MDDDYRKRSESASRVSHLADQIFGRRCLALGVRPSDVARGMGAIFEADSGLVATTNKTSQQ